MGGPALLIATTTMPGVMNDLKVHMIFEALENIIGS